jgi:hypothetical protein
MPASSSPSQSVDRPLIRRDFLPLLNGALEVGEWRYARRLATAWLAAFPGDLPVKYRYAQAIHKDTHLNTNRLALDILEELCLVDPEFREAQELLGSLRQSEGLESHFISKGCALALNINPRPLASKGEMAPIWARQLHEARTALAKYKHGDMPSLDKAEHAIHQALVENPDTPLAAVTHLSVMSTKGDMPSQAILSLAQIYHERWPECLQFSLILADRLMGSGDSTEAVQLLHQAVSKDVTGQVPQRLWGENYAYRSLWPESIAFDASSPNSPQSLPIPASVAARMGWNQITAQATIIPPTVTVPQASPPASPDGDLVSTDVRPLADPVYNPPLTKSVPVNRRKNANNLSEPVRAVQTELSRLAKQLKTPHVTSQDGRFPVYVVVTTRKGLESQYGVSAAKVLDDEIKKLVRAIRGRRINQETWGAILFYADDPEYTSYFDLQPIPHNDPWALKLLLADLDQALNKGGERIGAILIVGGPEVVPFHRLPNPVDDADAEVLSDNPYASSDENYFILDWPIGRLPGGSSNDPAGMLTILRNLTRRYVVSKKPLPWYKRFLANIRMLIQTRGSHFQSSFGYTAAVWRRAALAVYRSIGDPQELLVSPPVHACDIDPAGSPISIPDPAAADHGLILPKAHLAYFNLHGIPDSPFWYGHRDPAEPLPGLEFPVALRPQDVRNGGTAPQLIFTEACYGTHILGKGIEDALALKFLASDTQAIIGSTCISYGSLSTPLSAADLLGRVFWTILEEGFPAGEALKRAKLQLVREMHRRQGYLDAEDQKTLISFVLYGDPLSQPYSKRHNSKSLYRRNDLPHTIQTVSEQPEQREHPDPISADIVAHVKSIVTQYLPGMEDANLRLTQAHPDQKSMGAGMAQTTGTASPLSGLAGRQVVMLSKNILQAQLQHAQYARLTMDSSGKLLKLTVSR